MCFNIKNLATHEHRTRRVGLLIVPEEKLGEVLKVGREKEVLEHRRFHHRENCSENLSVFLRLRIEVKLPVAI